MLFVAKIENQRYAMRSKYIREHVKELGTCHLNTAKERDINFHRLLYYVHPVQKYKFRAKSFEPDRIQRFFFFSKFRTFKSTDTSIRRQRFNGLYYVMWNPSSRL